ncbi:hypothetical protein [Chryseobacterium terrae]|uniref:DUF5671 domain-containing protein n=1 Tax=Chryseobacterium terrae TaxID=3163299 RepID=A0ABW8Y4N7_9FLAO
MISAEEKLQIENYLISKKLPLDILLEVKDHMISQIEESMKDDKINLEEAFSKVELSWKDNFSLTKYWMFFGHEKIPKIAKDIMKKKFNVILKKSFLLGLLFFGLFFLMIPFSNDLQSYKTLFVAVNSLFLLAPILLYLFNYKNEAYFKKDSKYKGKINFTLYQKNLTLLIVCFLGTGQIILKGGEELYNALVLNGNFSLVLLIGLSAYRLFVYTFAIFGIFNFLEHKKTLKTLHILD